MILIAIIVIIILVLVYSYFTFSEIPAIADKPNQTNQKSTSSDDKLEPDIVSSNTVIEPVPEQVITAPEQVITVPEQVITAPSVSTPLGEAPDVVAENPKCAPGLNNSGTTCWYDRGAGLIPGLQCPPGKIQRGALCYDDPGLTNDQEWTADYTYGDKCPTGTNSLITSCHYDRGVGLIPTLACPPGKVQRGALCYDPPPAGKEWSADYTYGDICPDGTSGTIATCMYDRGVGLIPTLACPPGKVQRGALCYDPLPDGKVWTADYTYGDACPSDTNGLIATCHYDRGAGLIPTLACPPGKVQRGALCYDPPPAGKEWSADYTYGDICPDGTSGTIATCMYDRGAGVIPKLQCPPGKVQRGALCYDPLPAGKEWTADYTYGDPCPTGTNGTIATCTYDRGAGIIPKLECPPGKVQRGALCYDPLPAGKEWTADYTYGDPCPTGTNSLIATCHYDRGVGKLPKLKSCSDIPNARDDGVSCWLDSYGRGVGRPRDQSCPSGWRNDGVNCWRDTLGNGVGTIPRLNDCPPNSWSNGIGDCVANTANREDGDNGAEPLWKANDQKWSPERGHYTDGCSWNRNSEAGMCFRKCPAGFFGRGHERCAANGADGVGVMRRVYDRGSTCGPNQSNVAGLCYNNCPSGYRFAGGNLCEPEGARTQPTKYSCNADEDMWGTGCYPKCKSGYDAVGCCICQPSNGGPRIVRNLGERQYCDTGDEMINGLCYTKPKDGFGCTLTTCSKSRNPVTLGADKSSAMRQICPTDKPFNDAGLCYANNREGFGCAATICSKGRNPVTLGADKSLVMQQICPTDKPFNDAGLCYPNTKNGFGCGATICSKSRNPVTLGADKSSVLSQYCNNPAKPHLDAGLCYPKDKNGFGCAATTCSKSRNPVTIGADKSSVLSQYCNDPAKPHLDAGLCYPKDKDSFSCAATICSKNRNPVTLGADKSSVLSQYCNDSDKPQLEDGLCYKNDLDGFVCGATICSKDRRVTTLGANKSSVMQQVCPSDKPYNDGGLCYSEDRAGFKCAATICSQPIGSGFIGSYDDSNEEFSNNYNYLEEIY